MHKATSSNPRELIVDLCASFYALVGTTKGGFVSEKGFEGRSTRVFNLKCHNATDVLQHAGTTLPYMGIFLMLVSMLYWILKVFFASTMYIGLVHGIRRQHFRSCGGFSIHDT